MNDLEWWTVAANALVAAVLVSAGLAKLAFPEALGRALRDVLGMTGSLTVVPRTVAVAETVAGVALLVPVTRTAAAAGAAVLGLVFAALGALGRARRSTVPCGCFGPRSDRPLGIRNVLVGLALLPLLPLNASVTVPAGEYAGRALLTAALLMLVLCLWANRGLVVNLLRRPDSARATRE